MRRAAHTASLRRPVARVRASTTRYLLDRVGLLGVVWSGHAPEVERLRLLCLMRVLAFGVDIQLLEHGSSETVAREHPFDRLLDGLFGTSRHELGIRGRAQTARIAGMPVVLLVGDLVPGQDNLGSVNHHDVVTAVEIGREVGLVLATKKLSDLRGEPTQHDTIRVHDPPVAHDLMRLCRVGSHIFLLAVSSRLIVRETAGYRHLRSSVKSACSNPHHTRCLLYTSPSPRDGL